MKERKAVARSGFERRKPHIEPLKSLGIEYSRWFTEKYNNGKVWENQVAAYLLLLGYEIEFMRSAPNGKEVDIYAIPHVPHAYDNLLVECHDSRDEVPKSKLTGLLGPTYVREKSREDVTPVLATTEDLRPGTENMVTDMDIPHLRPEHIWDQETPEHLPVPIKFETEIRLIIEEKDLPTEWSPEKITWLNEAGFGWVHFRNESVVNDWFES